MKNDAQLRHIKLLFNAISRSLFRIDGKLSYDRITEGIISLCDELNEAETDVSIWYLGEFTECTLDDLIVGAFWHYAEWHSGQGSQSYAALSALGTIFSPGMTFPEPDNSAYQQLEAKADGSLDKEIDRILGEKEAKTYPETYLHVSRMEDGEEWIVPITSRETLDLKLRIKAWLKDEFGGELALDGEIQPMLDGQYYGKIMTDARSPESGICWNGGGFYTKVTYE